MKIKKKKKKILILIFFHFTIFHFTSFFQQQTLAIKYLEQSSPRSAQPEKVRAGPRPTLSLSFHLIDKPEKIMKQKSVRLYSS